MAKKVIEKLGAGSDDDNADGGVGSAPASPALELSEFSPEQQDQIAEMVARQVAKMTQAVASVAEAPPTSSRRDLVKLHLTKPMPKSQFFFYETMTVERAYSLIPDKRTGQDAQDRDIRTNGVFVQFTKTPYPFGHELVAPNGKRIRIFYCDLAINEGVAVTKEDLAEYDLVPKVHRIKTGDHSLKDAIAAMMALPDYQQGLEAMSEGQIVDCERYQLWLSDEYDMVWTKQDKERARKERWKSAGNRAARAAGHGAAIAA